MAIFEHATSLKRFLVEAPAIAKVITFFLVWAGCWLPIAVPLAIALHWRPPKPLTVQQKLSLLAPLYLIAPLLLWGLSQLERVPFSSYGIAWKSSVLTSLTIGLSLGIFGVITLFSLEWLLGWVQWQRPTLSDSQTSSKPLEQLAIGASVVLPIVVLGLWIGGTEELIFRGFLQNQLQQDYSVWVGGAIASLIFALLHLIWEGRERIPQLPGLWLMGMVLVLARLADQGSLGLAWGLHAGWIVSMTTLDTLKLVHYTGRGPEWMTGLNAQPLAGGIGFLLLLGTASILWFLA